MVRVQGKDGVYEIENGDIKWYSDKPRRIRGFEKVSNAPVGTILPTRKTKGSAAYDFYMPEGITVPPHGFSKLVQINIKAYMPKDEVLLLFVRSSIGLLRHITLANGTGVIDSDYYNNPENEGNIGLVLQNNGDEPQTFCKGDRIMQGLFVKYGVADDDKPTEERKGGIGSTGK